MSFTYAHRWKQPYLLVKGVDNALTADVYLSSTGAQQTATAATVTIRRGSTAVVTDVAATSLGPPASYTLTAANTSALTVDPTERWRVVWSLTISGTVRKFADRPAFLVDYDMWPQIITADMTDEQPDLSRLLGTTLTTFAKPIENAWFFLFRDLYSRSIHPQQITDGGYLREAHLMLSIALAYEAAAAQFNDSLYMDRAERFRARYEQALSKPVDYDGDADQNADDQGTRATPIVHDPYAERPRVG